MHFYDACQSCEAHKIIFECNIMQCLVYIAVCQSFPVWNLLLVGNFLCKYFINCLLKVTISECHTKRNEENNCIKQLTERNAARREIERERDREKGKGAENRERQYG